MGEVGHDAIATDEKGANPVVEIVALMVANAIVNADLAQGRRGLIGVPIG
jgi:hypothetical protein